MSVEPAIPGGEAESAAPAAPSIAVTPSTPEAAPITTGGDGTTPVSSWRDSLSVDLKDNQTLSKFESVEALAKEHVNVQKLIGADKVIVPNAESTPEELNAFYQKLGRPGKVEDYDLEGVERPADLPWDDEFQGSMLTTMHEAGLSSVQVQKVLSAYIESVSGQFQFANGEVQRVTETGIQDLRNEWGGSYDAQIDLSKRAFASAAGEDHEELAGIKLHDGTLLGDHPKLIKAFAVLGGKMSEHGLVGANASTRTTMSPVEAGNAVKKLMGDADFMAAYTEESHPEHALSVQKMRDLMVAQVSDSERE